MGEAAKITATKVMKFWERNQIQHRMVPWLSI